MIEKNKSLSVFLLHFLERLNGCESIEKKITESLTDICTFYKFKKDLSIRPMVFVISS